MFVFRVGMRQERAYGCKYESGQYTCTERDTGETVSVTDIFDLKPVVWGKFSVCVPSRILRQLESDRLSKIDDGYRIPTRLL